MVMFDGDVGGGIVKTTSRSLADSLRISTSRAVAGRRSWATITMSIGRIRSDWASDANCTPDWFLAPLCRWVNV
jgi:hypothetical protein